MVGIMQIMVYLLCVYLIFKGVEILQIALMSESKHKGLGLSIGLLMFVVSVACALTFTYMVDKQAESISNVFDMQSNLFNSQENKYFSPSGDLKKKNNMTRNQGDYTEPPKSEPPLSITDIDGKVTESNDMWWKYAWKLTVKNPKSRPVNFSCIIEFQDKDGFPIDQDLQYGLAIPANSERTFTGYVLIDAKTAPNVSNIVAKPM